MLLALSIAETMPSTLHNMGAWTHASNLQHCFWHPKPTCIAVPCVSARSVGYATNPALSRVVESAFESYLPIPLKTCSFNTHVARHNVTRHCSGTCLTQCHTMSHNVSTLHPKVNMPNSLGDPSPARGSSKAEPPTLLRTVRNAFPGHRASGGIAIELHGTINLAAPLN